MPRRETSRAAVLIPRPSLVLGVGSACWHPMTVFRGFPSPPAPDLRMACAHTKHREQHFLALREICSALGAARGRHRVPFSCNSLLPRPREREGQYIRRPAMPVLDGLDSRISRVTGAPTRLGSESRVLQPTSRLQLSRKGFGMQRPDGRHLDKRRQPAPHAVYYLIRPLPLSDQIFAHSACRVPVVPLLTENRRTEAWSARTAERGRGRHHEAWLIWKLLASSG